MNTECKTVSFYEWSTLHHQHCHDTLDFTYSSGLRPGFDLGSRPPAESQVHDRRIKIAAFTSGRVKLFGFGQHRIDFSAEDFWGHCSH